MEEKEDRGSDGNRRTMEEQAVGAGRTGSVLSGGVLRGVREWGVGSVWMQMKKL